ncbi:4-hydroxyproline epimerase [Acinetobacter sp. B5B]|uniref:4-hydroxyproline epimerase n=1 Tax=Acinetobacter baretiae TaxID=2605383 RepID=UPI0018C2D34A|nr:4-hydroxyproline epimerase [Acinetobacter baretiae]MBF7682621.1 4-hydroxyproline epimerase [Acinetobacter baretiae]
MQKINIIDSHTGGEPTRLVLNGFPFLGHGNMASRKAILAEKYDHFRTSVMLEPRGNDVLVGALLCEPVNPHASAGVIFFNNCGYLNMCGHGTIGLIASLAYLNKISVGTHIIETVVGDIQATLHADMSISIRNVISYRYKKDVVFTVPDLGVVKGDIAWGGNWFFLISEHGQDLSIKNISQLTKYTSTIKSALKKANITGADGQEIDHIELFSDDPHADSKNFVLCPGQAYDRSPCGTGTSAKIACLAADKKLLPHQIWTQASIIGSQFKASFETIDDHLIPTITGTAHISAETTLIIDERDPFAWGIQP